MIETVSTPKPSPSPMHGYSGPATPPVGTIVIVAFVIVVFLWVAATIKGKAK